MLVSDVGEEGLIELLADRLPPASGEVWIGDDAAVVAAPSDRLLLTTDTMVEGSDFDLSYATGADIGWKVIAINVSDIAAMGGEPSKGLTTLCLPPATELRFVEELVDGLLQATDRYGLELVGGDISAAESISIGVAVLGSVQGEPWLRSGATVGDALCVTGALGGSFSGLQALRADPAAGGPGVTRHLRPEARLEAAKALSGSRISSGIDISDGLVIDLGRLTRASQVGCEVSGAAIPVDEGIVEGSDAALFGGEDFELLVTMPEDAVSGAVSAVESCGIPLTRIGTVTSGEATLDGRPLRDMKEKAWDHLRTR